MYSLADTFLLNNRANLRLLDALTEEQLAYVPSLRARSIADQLAHLHKARLMWLKVCAPAVKIGESGLRAELEVSAEAIAAVIADAERAGKMRGYKRGPATFCGYLLAHEGHHRGQIILHLKHAKMPVDKAVAHGIWEWEKL